MVDCPHCGLETKLYIPGRPLTSGEIQGSQSAPQPEPAKAPAPTKVNREPPSQFYFYKSKEGEKGPYTEGQLRSLWANGIITANAVYRRDKSSIWLPLCDSPIITASELGQMARRIPPLRTVQQWAFKGVCLLSLAAFFLTNVRISVPIVGKIDCSMFSFLAPQPQSPSTDKEIPRLHISALFGSESAFHLKDANAAQMIIAIALLGLLLHYLLTLMWVTTTFGFKKNAPPLNTIWLVLAVQFPILFTVGARLILAGATSEAINALKDDQFGFLGVAFANNVSLTPGVVMWLLMLLCLAALSLPLVARKLSLPWENRVSETPLTSPPGTVNPSLPGTVPQEAPTEIRPRVSPFGVAGLVLGVVACVVCWIPPFRIFIVPLAVTGLLASLVGIVMVSSGKKTGFILPISAGIVCVLSILIAWATYGAAQVAKEWSKSGAVRQGDTEVRGMAANVGQVCYRDELGRPQFTKAYLTITLSISNLSSNRTVAFESWRDAGNAKLSDNFGNNYKRVSVTPAPNLLDPAPDNASIHPRKQFYDPVVFETPIKDIEWLHLEVSARNFGGKGMLRFEIPANRIKGLGSAMQ